MKFSEVRLGTLAEKPVSFAHREATIKFAFRPLDGVEAAAVHEKATEFARSRKADKCEPGNPIYDYGVMVHSIALAAVDVDSPKDHRELYFDGGVDAVLGAFGQEESAYLYAIYEAWQGECSPTVRQMSSAQMVESLVKLAEDDSSLFFSTLSPAITWRLLRFSASQWLRSHVLSSRSSTPSSESEPPQTKAD